MIGIVITIAILAATALVLWWVERIVTEHMARRDPVSPPESEPVQPVPLLYAGTGAGPLRGCPVCELFLTAKVRGIDGRIFDTWAHLTSAQACMNGMRVGECERGGVHIHQKCEGCGARWLRPPAYNFSDKPCNAPEVPKEKAKVES